MSMQVTQEKRQYIPMNIPIDDINYVLDYFWLSYLSNYNDFYHPNLCHVCKRTNDGNLILCDKCHMISYCSEEHKHKHYREHRALCECIAQYLKERNSNTMWLTCDDEQWISSRYEVIKNIFNRLQRQPIYYEERMIFATKSCCICHCQINLNCCQRCYSVNYCSEHVLEFQEHHVSICDTFLLTINLAIIQLNTKALKISHILFPETAYPINDMDSFLIRYVRKFPYKRHKSRTSLEYIYSEYLSTPLTIYEMLKNTDLLRSRKMSKSKWIVHIIGRTTMENDMKKAWELLLHSLTYIKVLKLVFIGVQFQNKRVDIHICYKCKFRCQSIICETHNYRYAEYVNSSSFEQPSMILISHMSISPNKEDSFLDEMQLMKCPSFLTSHGKSFALKNMKIIKKYLNINPIYNGPSNFKSLMPVMKVHSDEIYYYNSYVTIYST